MLKVVLILKQIVLRVRKGEMYVVIKKRKESIVVGSNYKIINGVCDTNSTSEFYMSAKDPLLNIEVIFVQGSKRKLAGNTILNIIQWQPNVLHQTVSTLNNSPDKKARLIFNFYYFLDHALKDTRQIFLTSERKHEQLQTLQQKNHQLLNLNKQLEKELGNEEKLNVSLINIKKKRELDIDQSERALKEQIELHKKSVTDSNQKCQQSKTMRSELQKLAKDKGLLSEPLQ